MWDIGYEYITSIDKVLFKAALRYTVYYSVESKNYKVLVLGRLGRKDVYCHLEEDESETKVYDAYGIQDNLYACFRNDERDIVEELHEAIIQTEIKAGRHEVAAELMLLGYEAFLSKE